MSVVTRARAICLAALAAITVATPAARAQTVAAARFQTFMASDFHKGLITRTLAGIPPAVYQRCPALVSQASQITVLRPVTYGPSGIPNAGAWRESFPVSGCGNDTTLNLFFAGTPGDKVNVLVAAPGGSRADLALQKDAFSHAALGARTIAKDCTAFYVRHTTFDGFGSIDPPSADPGPDSRSRPWHETWMMTGCGRAFAVPIQFTPDDKGTTISQHLGDVREEH